MESTGWRALRTGGLCGNLDPLSENTQPRSAGTTSDLHKNRRDARGRSFHGRAHAYVKKSR